MTWLEYIIEALNNLGGVATYPQIYEEIRRIRKEPYTKSWKASVRATIESFSSDSMRYNQKSDIFYSVKGLGEGIWGLRELKTIKYQEAVDVNENIQLNEGEETYRVEMSVKRIIRDTRIIKELKALHNNTCQICGLKIKLTGNTFYSEGHHIKPLGKPHNGKDEKENVIIVCPNCHAMCDYGAMKIDLAKVRKVKEHEIKEEYVEYYMRKICIQDKNNM